MQILILNASVYRTATRTFSRGDLVVRDGVIAAVSEGMSEAIRSWAGLTFDAAGARVIPGLVDVHTHGRAGGDFISADGEKLIDMAKSYLSSGVTTLLPTLASAPLDLMKEAVDRINRAGAYLSTRPGAGAAFGGIHVEGRYLNVKRRGAHAPELLATPDPAELVGFLDTVSGARHITFAPELDAGAAFAKAALGMGATLALGHSDATYAEAVAAFDGGVTAVTHLFNALPPLHHRAGGAVCAALTDSRVYTELICDGFHIAPEVVALAAKLKGDRLTLITDSMEATGCPDGEYSIAGMPVTVSGGKARTHDGAIAGSTLSLWDGVRNYCAFAGLPLETGIYAATAAPALEVGLFDRVGSLEEGKAADLLVLDGDGGISRIMRAGQWFAG